MSVNRRSFLTLGTAVTGGAFIAGIAGAPAVTPTAETFPTATTTGAAIPSREFRGLWIATVNNIDFPKGTSRTADSLKTEFIAWLDFAKSMNLNAVISQIRPTADAFWPSPYEPWSQYLTGTQGKNPGFDVLKFQIEEAHKRNLEFHAWFNPYRVAMTESMDHLVSTHPAKVHPEWSFPYSGKRYYNPGIPEVRRFCEDAMLHAVKNYDIDAVHFDDYFYPYAVDGKDYPDAATYKKYSNGTVSIKDWRRENINTLVREMDQRIHQAKPWVKFGISPFGIWRNQSSTSLGSATTGTESYEVISADTRTWVKQNWVDYIAPQLYWNVGLPAADYGVLAPWWNDVVKGTNVSLYIGEASYKQTAGTFSNPDELLDHVGIARGLAEVDGQIYYNATETKNGFASWAKELRDQHYSNPAIVPAMPHLGGSAPATPTDVRVVAGPQGVRVRWIRPEGKVPTSYAVYKVSGPGYSASELENGRNLLASVRANGKSPKQTVLLENIPAGTFLVVTAFDRTWNESSPSAPKRAS